MTSVALDEFLNWASKKGLGLDPKYPRSTVLKYLAERDARFWDFPGHAAAVPRFIASLIDLMRDWRSCYVWRRGGRWPDFSAIDSRRTADEVEHTILNGIGLPIGQEVVIAFEPSERAPLITLLFSASIFNVSVRDDLYIIPDHAEQFLHLDHHGVMHVSFAKSDDINRWVTELAAKGFSLPEELLDETFKTPDWMKSGKETLPSGDGSEAAS